MADSSSVDMCQRCEGSLCESSSVALTLSDTFYADKTTLNCNLLNEIFAR